MAKLILSMDGLVLKEIALNKERTSIGRRATNDIQIDNLAISGEHARVVTLRELIIERALPLPDAPIDFEEFKIIVLMVLWCRETPLDPLIVDELISAEPPQYLH